MPPPSDLISAAVLLDIVDGASWVYHDAPRRRFIVWTGGDHLDVYASATGAPLGPWPIHAEQPDRQAARDTVTGRIAAGH